MSQADDPYALDESQLTGFRQFAPIAKWLDTLSDAGCRRDRAHNRRLFMDELVSLYLLFMFNPICSSLRSLQRASDLPKVQKKLGVSRAALGSLSEASRVFDASLLEPIIADLVAKVGPLPQHARLSQLGAVVTLVDGTHLTGLSTVARSLWVNGNGRGVKAHLHYELLKGVPVSATFTEAHQSEVRQLAQSLQPGRLYVDDRGYACYGLMQQIIDAGSSFVGRVKEDAAVRELIEERVITDEARAAGVVRDRVVTLGTPHHKQDLTAHVRLVEVHVTPHPGRKAAPGTKPTVLLLATDRLDLPAEVIALIYQMRWQIELFFRFFKHVLGCRHLLSHSENGIKLQVYSAIIACLLMALYTGRKPNKATAELFGWYAMGYADESDIHRHIEGLPRQTN